MHICSYAITNVHIVVTIDHFVVYESETDIGSTGSPILKEHNGNLLIVGIHKAGDKESKLFNMGVLFSEILCDLNGEKLNPSKQIEN